MYKRLPVFLVLLAILPVTANISVFSDTQNPIARQMELQTTDIWVAEVVICGARMFLAAAQYNHVDADGYDFMANDQALRLVYNSMTYLLDPEDQSVTSGYIGCIGEFDTYSGLQEGTDYYPAWDLNFMQFVEENLTAEGCTFDLVQIDKDTPLIDDGQILYDIVMIGEEWDFPYLHTRGEYSAYVSLGGKIILGCTWRPVPEPAGAQLDFLPKNRIWAMPFNQDEFLLPAADPSHPIAANIVNPQWWYDIYEPVGVPINNEQHFKMTDYDVEYYYKVFAAPPGFPDGPTTLVAGGQWIENSVVDTSWGAIKAQF